MDPVSGVTINLNFGRQLETKHGTNPQPESIPSNDQNVPIISVEDRTPIDKSANEVGELTIAKSCFTSFMKMVEPVVPWTSTLGSLLNSAGAAAALGFFVESKCTESKAPYIAAVALSGAVNFITFFKDYYDDRTKKNDEKKALEKERIRDSLEKKRHEELSSLLLKTLASVQKYQISRDKEHFKECLQAVKDLPDDSKSHPMIRELWLSTVVQMSNDEDNLKTTLNSLEKLGINIQEKQNNLPIPAKVTFKNGKTEEIKGNTSPGEGKSAVNYREEEVAIAKSLNLYENEWKKMEEKLGFPLQFIELKEVRYERPPTLSQIATPKPTINVEESSDDEVAIPM